VRKVFSDALQAFAGRPDFVFFTGDLGFMALESLREKAGGRFVNAGLSEQNMVSVAAGMASAGFRPWVYSIATFVYARPFEQIRNDVCIHDLPVKLVGNGGGFAYGIMGATHHALDDYGVLSALPNMKVFIPAFDSDVPAAIEKMALRDHPAYLRLGLDEKPSGFEAPLYAPWRKLLCGFGPTLLAVGPLAGGLLGRLAGVGERERPNLWVLTELPTGEGDIPLDFLADLESSGRLGIVEEHIAHGGAGDILGRTLLRMGKAPKKWYHFFAKGYLSGTYGSQTFHRNECGLNPDDVWKAMNP
jgi:transketolase